MLYTIPHYYKRFQCIADRCEATCCAGWQIMIDPKSLKKYKNEKSAFGNRLHNSIDWKEQCFCQYDHKCAFLNEENLCDLYAEMGKDALCRTCKNYPRHIEEFEDVREITLSLSCPEAARIILSCKEPVHFLKKENDKREEYTDFDYLFYTELTEVRAALIRLLQNRRIRWNTRMAMVLALSHDFQIRIRRKELYQTDQLIKRYEADGAVGRFEKKISEYQGQKEAAAAVKIHIYETLEKLEVLDLAWPDFLKKMKENQGRKTKSGAAVSETIWWEQLMVYFISTYFCGAVYDEEAYGKVKLAVISTLAIKDMAEYLWTTREDLHNQCVRNDLVEAAYRYSRELEHSSENLNQLEKILITDDEFSINRLMMLVSV